MEGKLDEFVNRLSCDFYFFPHPGAVSVCQAADLTIRARYLYDFSRILFEITAWFSKR
jgi:hypothetical protein